MNNGCEVVTPIAGQGQRDGRQEQEVRPLDSTVGREDFERRKVWKLYLNLQYFWSLFRLLKC